MAQEPILSLSVLLESEEQKTGRGRSFALRKLYVTSIMNNSSIYCFANRLLWDILFHFFVSTSSFSFKGTFTLIFPGVLFFLSIVNTKLPCAKQCNWNYMMVLIRLFTYILKPTSLALLLPRNPGYQRDSECDCCPYNTARFVNEMIISLSLSLVLDQFLSLSFKQYIEMINI